jgi:hypothetical protein
MGEPHECGKETIVGVDRVVDVDGAVKLALEVKCATCFAVQQRVTVEDSPEGVQALELVLDKMGRP